MKISDDKEMEATVVNDKGTKTGHITVTTIGGKNGGPKQTISYMAECVIGQGSFGVVFQAKCLKTGEAVVIKKVLQDKRYKNRELQTMRVLDHPNVVGLKHCFFLTTKQIELYLNLVLEFVPEMVHRMIRHYNKMSQRISMIYVKLYSYQLEEGVARVIVSEMEPICVLQAIMEGQVLLSKDVVSNVDIFVTTTDNKDIIMVDDTRKMSNAQD